MRAQTNTVLIDDSLTANGRSYLFEAAERVIKAREPEAVATALQAMDAALADGAFLAGYFAYELGLVLEPRLRPLLPAKRPTPLLWFGVYRQRRELSPSELDAFLAADGESYEIDDLALSMGREDYQSRFGRLKSYIAAGDIYQLNLTLKGRFDFRGAPRALYRDLRRKQPVAYGALIETPGLDVLSASPELFLAIDQGRVRTRPMKGTADRGTTLEHDEEIRRWLSTDIKSRAENLMIADLMRNDIGRIARMGSVRVTDLFSVETYDTLHQMTSGVTAELRDGLGLGELMESVFPPGSVTGAPKVRAVEIIAELEAEPRGIYTGAIGTFAPDGSSRFNVAIRTVTLDRDGRGEIGIGSGVVQDSAADAEYEECLLKMAFLTNPVRSFELIETLLFEPGTGYALLERHLRRLTRSARYFGFAFDEAGAVEALAREALGFGATRRRVRLLLARDGTVTITSVALPVSAPPASMRFVIAAQRVRSGNPFLYHKTTERGFYDSARVDAGETFGADEVIFLNERGEITEGSITNIFLERDGTLLTPALACGLLPGTLREELMARGEAREAVLTPADLESADRVWLGNSVRGLLPAERIETPLSQAVGGF